jgi:very-short-patch-repair endonuclease
VRWASRAASPPLPFCERHYRVLRFWNNDVMQNIDGVLEMIAGALQVER